MFYLVKRKKKLISEDILIVFGKKNILILLLKLNKDDYIYIDTHMRKPLVEEKNY